MSKAPDGSDAGKSSLTISIETNKKEALFQLKKFRSYHNREDATVSQFFDDAIDEWLRAQDDLPEDVRELLDESNFTEEVDA